jgi:hypothetical protein
MNILTSSVRLVLPGLVCLALARPARAASDPRRILCAQPCTLVLQGANGSIDIKDANGCTDLNALTARRSLKTLYQSGDQYPLEGGREYVLFFNESNDGLFDFDLQIIPGGQQASWSCRVHTIAGPPFIAVEHQAWSTPQEAGQVTVDTRHGKRFIDLAGQP